MYVLMEEGMLLCVASPPILYKLLELMAPSVVLYLQQRVLSRIYCQ